MSLRGVGGRVVGDGMDWQCYAHPFSPHCILRHGNTDLQPRLPHSPAVGVVVSTVGRQATDIVLFLEIDTRHASIYVLVGNYIKVALYIFLQK